MLLFFILPVLSYEMTDLVPCLDMVKWKIDNFEETFDKILALSKLNPESHLDKIIAGMIKHCASSLNTQIKSQILSKDNLLNLDHLVPFPIQPFIHESELELTKEEDQILEQLQEYTKNLGGVDYYLIFLATSFAFVVIFVVIKNLSIVLKHQKLFKMD